MEDPLTNVCRRNTHHPQMGAGLPARAGGDRNKFSSLLKKTKTDSWRYFLSHIHPADTGAFYKYIQKADRRRPRQSRNQCSTPLLKDGEIYATSQSQCDLLGDFFKERLNGPQLHAELKAWKAGIASKWRTKCRGRQNKVYRRYNRRQRGQKRSKRNRCRVGPSGKRLPRRPPKPRPNEIPGSVTDEEFRPVRSEEVAKSVQSLAPNKTAGPDGYQVDISKRLPQTAHLLALPYTAFFRTGNFPKHLLDLVLIPFDKPGKPSEDYAAKRPISPISSISQTLEAIALNRLIPKLEGGLNTHQYAFRSDRNTEYHLTELYDITQHAIAKWRQVALASLDKVPHTRLLESLSANVVGGYLPRYIRVWLTRRRFTLRLASPQGRKNSENRDIARGFPQGGALSPFLRLLSFDSLEKLLRGKREKRRPDLKEAKVRILIYADGITFLAVHENPETLVQAARKCAGAIKEVLQKHLGLEPSQGKSFNLVSSPGNLPAGLFRRTASMSRAERGEQEHRENQSAKLEEEDDLLGRTPEGTFPAALAKRLPFTRVQ